MLIVPLTPDFVPLQLVESANEIVPGLVKPANQTFPSGPVLIPIA